MLKTYAKCIFFKHRLISATAPHAYGVPEFSPSGATLSLTHLHTCTSLHCTSYLLRDLKPAAGRGVTHPTPPPRTSLNSSKINISRLLTFKKQWLRSSEAPRHFQDATRRSKTPPRRPKTRLRHLQVTILVDFGAKNEPKLTPKSHPEIILC